jgi:hypothetical protein
MYYTNMSLHSGTLSNTNNIKNTFYQFYLKYSIEYPINMKYNSEKDNSYKSFLINYDNTRRDMQTIIQECDYKFNILYI